MNKLHLYDKIISPIVTEKSTNLSEQNKIVFKVPSNANKDNLKICANNPSKESAEEEVSVDYAGESFEIGFNISYVQESLSVISNSEVELVFFGSENSCLVKNIDDESLIHVIMPMRL